MNFNFDEIVDRSNTFATKTDAKQMNRIPEEAIPMWVADMDFRVAPVISDAVIQRAAHTIYGYSLKPESYNNAIVNWMQRRHNWTIKPNWIVSVPGVVPALHYAVRALLKAGDKVIVQQPVYPPFMDVVRTNGYQLLNNSLRLENGQYTIDFEDFEQKAQDPRTKLFILCSPHNPAGRVWSQEELMKLADICLRHDVLILSDEIHHDLVLPGHKHIPTASLSPEISKITITCTAPSKTFNIAGMQSANVIIEDAKLRREFTLEVSKSGYHDPNPFAIVATEAGYTQGDEWLDQLIQYIDGNKKLVMDFIREKLPMLEVIDSQATYLLWIDFSKLGLSSKELDRFMRHDALLWLNSGYVFGEEGSTYQRMNIGCSRLVVQEALTRLEQAIQSR
ncbi:putative C-S lyase [Paenibacillus albiflavus]|uniref:cysteine-S-conjugate beta-lyase n=1 Tax=Paenibacillus albiflavus TaxID=2545760 RepID=A0A4R4EGC5_9BACL|nr:PatB family C-S lyase [Paenibacillus albiflavus]TCZ78829.1 putative C-S lyase [Paenibacillus albiflavus]